MKKNVPLLVAIALVILLSLYYMNMTEFFETNGIPKIIHQTAPTDKSKWHPDWEACQETWKKFFPDFEYKMWNDEEIDMLVKDTFPDFYNKTYTKYDKKIKKIDSARYCMLYTHGGMYVDMDYKCFKNFWSLIPHDKICISESPFPDEYLQNAMMISKPKQKFWSDVIDECNKRGHLDVLEATGPRLLTHMYNLNKDDIFPLPVNLYNPAKETPDNNTMIARQFMTATWTL